MRDERRAVLRGAAAQIGSRAGGTALTVATTAVLARRLGTSGLGSFQAVLLFSGLVAIATESGFALAAPRLIASAADSDRPRVQGGTLAVKAAAQGVLLLLVLLATVGAVWQGADQNFVVVLLANDLMTLVGSLTVVLQVHYALAWAALADLAARLVLLVAALVAPPQVGVLVWAYVGATATQVVVAALGARGRGGVLGWLPSAERAALLAQAARLGALGVLGWINFRLDSLTIALFRARSDLGLYALAYRVVDLLVVLPALLSQALLPLLARARARGDGSYERLVQPAGDLLLFAAVGMVSVLVTEPRAVVLALGGPHFSAATVPYGVLCLAGAFSFLNPLYSTVAVVGGREPQLLRISLGVVCATAVADVVVIPPLGLAAAAVVTLVSEAVGFLLVRRLARRHEVPGVRFRRPVPLLVAGCVALLLGRLAAAVVPDLTAPVVTAAAFVAATTALRCAPWAQVRELLRLIGPWPTAAAPRPGLPS